MPSIPEKLAGKLNAKCRKSSKFYTELESLYVSVSSLPPPFPPPSSSLPRVRKRAFVQIFPPSKKVVRYPASSDTHFPSHSEVANPFTRSHRSRRRRKTRMTGFVWDLDGQSSYWGNMRAFVLVTNRFAPALSRPANLPPSLARY